MKFSSVFKRIEICYIGVILNDLIDGIEAKIRWFWDKN